VTRRNKNLTELIRAEYKEDREILSDVEQDIVQYIANNQDECYDDILAKENRWEVYYHLSETRTSILNWYDFEKKSSILEVGGGFGAITGMLCRRAKEVTVIEKSIRKAEAIAMRYRSRDNLTIYAGDVEKMRFGEQFDYVIITGAVCNGEGGAPEKQLESYIQRAKVWLKKTGILLLAVDNINGAKFQCGYPKPVAGGINENGCEAMADREQLKRIASEAGFGNIKFYYPFPDYRVAQEIYTDTRLPQGNLKDRVLTYYVLPRTLYKNEYQFYQEKIEKGDIRDICNSYLLECSCEHVLSDAAYVSVSTDRGKQHSFSTVIGKNQVLKTAIYDEGREYLRKSYENILQIQKRGIHVVPLKYEDNRLIMPEMKGSQLARWLFETAVEDREKYIEAVDKLYRCILKSSDIEERGDKLYLKNGYIDMIPLNCFVEDDEYYFFDQEFCKKDCPVGYIMFRGLRYTYLTYPALESYVSLEEMKRRYGLQNEWQEYLLEEDAFIWDNRQHRVNHCFYKWVENQAPNRPIASIDGVCGLFTLKGFDVPESDGQNTWIWMIEEDARIYVKNYQNKKIKAVIMITFNPPPGKTGQVVRISGKTMPENEINAPASFRWKEEIEAEEMRELEIHVMGKLTRSDNGDLRSFALQLVNPQMTLED
jgi:hypothetical protein